MLMRRALVSRPAHSAGPQSLIFARRASRLNAIRKGVQSEWSSSYTRKTAKQSPSSLSRVASKSFERGAPPRQGEARSIERRREHRRSSGESEHRDDSSQLLEADCGHKGERLLNESRARGPKLDPTVTRSSRAEDKYDSSRQSRPQYSRGYDTSASQRVRTQRTGEDRRDTARIRSMDEGDADAAISTVMPLSTAASQFIYGRSPALACLLANRRKIYKAYLAHRALGDDNGDSGQGSVPDLCQKLEVPTISMRSFQQRRAMESIAIERPHNGVVLEVSPVPAPPVVHLGTPSPLTGPRGYHTELNIAPQSQEEASIDSALSSLITKSSWRKPIVLLLDGVLDQGNMGNIIRTAHFYGVDAVAVCTGTCAPIASPIVAKAASGALEAVPILRIERPSDFIEGSKRKGGWEVWASVAPPNFDQDSITRTLYTSKLNSPLVDRPAILMLGGEGTGLRDLMKNKADKRITIAGREHKVDVGVDSLNVGSAAAVLIEAFMRKPNQALVPGSEGPTLAPHHEKPVDGVPEDDTVFALEGLSSSRGSFTSATMHRSRPKMHRQSGSGRALRGRT